MIGHASDADGLIHYQVYTERYQILLIVFIILQLNIFNLITPTDAIKASSSGFFDEPFTKFIMPLKPRNIIG
jgi:hypothetical protein